MVDVNVSLHLKKSGDWHNLSLGRLWLLNPLSITYYRNRKLQSLLFCLRLTQHVQCFDLFLSCKLQACQSTSVVITLNSVQLPVQLNLQGCDDLDDFRPLQTALICTYVVCLIIVKPFIIACSLGAVYTCCILPAIRQCKSLRPVCVRYLSWLKWDTWGENVRKEFTRHSGTCRIIDGCSRWT